MAPSLLFDVITRQTGTIEKAWLEAIQNAIDAGGKKVEFNITNRGFTVKDDGKGMSKEEIIKYFEVFGQSAKRGNEEKLGEFGMGRGQIFAQGSTKWRTNNYLMEVDIKNKGLEYDFTEEKEKLNGTHISVELYDKLNWLENKLEKFKEWIKYVPIDIVVNGKLFSKEKLNNPINHNLADIELDTKGEYMQVYNRGLFVKNEHKGVGVKVVSKVNMKVNFARNDVMEDCKVFKQINDILDREIVREFRQAEYLNEPNKKAIINMMRSNPKLADEFSSKKVFKLANGQYTSLNELRQKGSYSIFDGEEERVADSLIDGGSLVLDRDWKQVGLLRQLGGINEADYGEISKDLKVVISEYTDEEDLTNDEKKNWELVNKIYYNSLGGRRKLKIGKSKVSAAWTDGRRYIAINKNELRGKGMSFIVKITHLLIHEESHTSDTSKSDLHGYEFYEKYYELMEDKLTTFKEVEEVEVSK
tara:strand:+ start:2956 stop:4374 length:1419 start_codon:yes stop_codon:yes gene_type:complete